MSIENILFVGTHTKKITNKVSSHKFHKKFLQQIAVVRSSSNLKFIFIKVPWSKSKKLLSKTFSIKLCLKASKDA
ncbi:hypothetical protein LEP1GSC186_3032 [Leptospira noguchii serovar Autumnalis str. ZUN142]|uniref:Uncharacterized protein n=1 Tax=Leptospira noguchii serovar Autumnalis str. ZUN142 TaxID=1085540 RepID=M6U892_9LEPT|nr:hypothetical protein LEP1GSC186_3032 [Leptospira noguchii serovar Autumnalis str. ZUN142]